MKRDEGEPGARGKYEVKSLARACSILAAFREPGEILELRNVAEKTGLNKVTTFRLLATLVANNLIERVGPHGYRSRLRPLEERHFRVGYAEQGTGVSFVTVVTESLKVAATAAGIDLVVVNNRASRKAALRNADFLIRERVDLALEFQVIADVAGSVADKFVSAGIPMIAVDNPHPGTIYFGADNYNAGLSRESI
jgi:ribose transport system substrate-binding protein